MKGEEGEEGGVDWAVSVFGSGFGFEFGFGGLELELEFGLEFGFGGELELGFVRGGSQDATRRWDWARVMAKRALWMSGVGGTMGAMGWVVVVRREDWGEVGRWDGGTVLAPRLFGILPQRITTPHVLTYSILDAFATMRWIQKRLAHGCDQ